MSLIKFYKMRPKISPHKGLKEGSETIFQGGGKR
jgi:hypothetical protein